MLQSPIEIYAGLDRVEQAYLNSELVWDRELQHLMAELVLWVPGLSGLTELAQDLTLTSDTPVTASGGLQFRDSNWIDLPNDLGYGQQVSAFSWFREIGVPQSNHHIIFGGSQLELTVHTTGYLRTGLELDGVHQVANFGGGIADGNPHHVGFTFDGTTMVRYIDGVTVGQSTFSSPVLTNVFSTRRIGRFGPSDVYYLNGNVYDLRIYKRALSAEAVEALARKTTFANLATVVGYKGMK